MASSSRSDLLRMGGFLAALLLVTGAVLLLTGGGGGSGDRPASGQVDGRLTLVEDTQLLLQPDGGGAVERFTVRPIDRRVLDLDHLQDHMAQGLPSRVIYESDGDERYAVRVDDLPASAATP